MKAVNDVNDGIDFGGRQLWALKNAELAEVHAVALARAMHCPAPRVIRPQPGVPRNS